MGINILWLCLNCKKDVRKWRVGRKFAERHSVEVHNRPFVKGEFEWKYI